VASQLLQYRNQSTNQPTNPHPQHLLMPLKCPPCSSTVRRILNFSRASSRASASSGVTPWADEGSSRRCVVVVGGGFERGGSAAWCCAVGLASIGLEVVLRQAWCCTEPLAQIEGSFPLYHHHHHHHHQQQLQLQQQQQQQQRSTPPTCSSTRVVSRSSCS